MKNLKWSLLVVVLVVALGFVSISPCTASDVQSDDTVMTDDNSGYDTEEQYADPDTAEDTDDESAYQEKGDYMDEPEGEPADEENY